MSRRDLLVAGEPVETLVARVTAAGASITTDGRDIRIREWCGPLPSDLAQELHRRRREVLAHLLEVPS